MGHGVVFWITGLSGAGKTSVATVLRARLVAAGHPVVLLDGDALRAVFGQRFGHDMDERRYLAMCYARLCRELALQGMHVICATISMFHEVRAWNRREIPGYREIYLRVPPDTRRLRDHKGVYASGDAAVEFGVTSFEEPRSPDVVIDNHGPVSAEDAVDVIWNALVPGALPAVLDAE